MLLGYNKSFSNDELLNGHSKYLHIQINTDITQEEQIAGGPLVIFVEL